MSPEAQERASRVATVLEPGKGLQWLDRAIVLDECGSTQDAALSAAAGRPGLVMTALRQVSGRGRLGRDWMQKADLGLAVTFVLDAHAHDAATVPISAACAVCVACERRTGPSHKQAAPVVCGIKWPNDVVVRSGAEPHMPAYRKVAGILIERRDGLLLLGIGINVLHGEGDWPESLRGSAVSLAQVGDPPGCDSLLCELIESVDRFLSMPRQAVRDAFLARDVLAGSHQTLVHDRARYTGVIESIDPFTGITLVLDAGARIVLPAETTTMLPVAPDRPHR